MSSPKNICQCGATKQTRSKHCNPCSKRGDRNPMFGRAVSQNTRAKLSESLIGLTRSVGTRRKMSESQHAERNPNWTGDAASVGAGRRRAQRLFKAEQCEICGITEGVIDRHHVDENTLNNDPSNIKILCRSCHLFVHKKSVFAGVGNSDEKVKCYDW